jgi:hypothetical protein
MSERSRRPAPVEPLSLQAWQRVESAVFARLDDGVTLSMPSLYVPHVRAARRSLRYHWLISVGLSVTAAAAASVIHVTHSAGSASPTNDTSVASTEGASSVEPAPSIEAMPSAAPATAPAPVLRAAPAAARPSTPSALDSSPDALHVATGRETRDITVGEALFSLSEHSEMLARGNDAQGWQVELTRGRVDFDVAPRQARPPFVIHSGDVEIRVVGTRFSVRRDGASTEVRVLRGIVEVERQGRVARLRPGDLWLDGVVAGTSHGARSGSSGAARAKIVRTPRPALRSDREIRFERAAGLEPGDAAEALALYLALARGQDAWAANALYAAARLELDRGDPESGILLLGEYSERFPDGENIVDVEALRARLGALP